MKFRLLPSILLTVGLVGAAQKNSEPRGKLSRTEAAAVFERFGRISVPASIMDVARTIGSPNWVSRAWMYHQTVLGGWIPIEHDLSPPGGVFLINLTPPMSQHEAGYCIYVHTTAGVSTWRWTEGEDDATRDLRRFFAGDSPTTIRIDEYALCYPDGRVLHVLPNSRKIWPSPW